MRRAVALALVFAACKGKHDEPPATGSVQPLTLGESCTQNLALAPRADDYHRAAAVIAWCTPCGDWTPILQWARPQQDGGPTRRAIADAMDRCQAFCDSTAKTYFLGTLDAARGTTSLKPWVELGKQCKDKVSAVPDARYMAAPFFALDRIARAGQHGASSTVSAFDFAVPAVSLTGVGVELPVVRDGYAAKNAAYHVTILGNDLYLGKLPRGRLGFTGVSIDYGGSPYPGAKVAIEALPDELAKIAHQEVALFAPIKLPAARILDVVAAGADRVTLVLAVAVPDAVWPVPAMLPTALERGDDIAITDDMTIQDLATAIAKLHKPRVGLGKKP